MRFLVDAQLPPALARWIGDRGFSAAPVRDQGLREADDGTIWNFALTGGWTVVTKDDGFVIRSVGLPDAPPVVWLRIGNCTTRHLHSWLAPRWADVLARLEAGERIVEVR